MRVLVSYRGAPRIRGWETGAMIANAFRSLGHDVFEYGNIYETKERLPNAPDNLDDIDLCVYCEMNDADPQYTELRSVRARKMVCCLYDTSYYADRCKHLVDYFRFDHLFIANPLTIQEYKTWGYDHVSYLPYACDRDLHGRSLEHPKTRDVVLVGSIRDDRRTLAYQLSNLGVDLELIGDVFREDYIDALASAKVVINQNPTDGRGLLNMRYWETPAAGSFVLTEAADYSEQPINLCNGYPYNGTEEIAGFCRAILDNPQRLAEATAATQHHVFKYHTYTNRCNDILGTLFPHHTS